MLHNKKTITIIIILGFIFSFSYNTLVINGFKKFEIKLKEVRNTRIKLPRKDTYLLKIWGVEPPEEIYFNYKKLSYFYSRLRGPLKEFYVKLSPEVISKDINRLEIIGPTSYSIKIKNFLGELEDIFILFDSSEIIKDRRIKITKLFLIFVCASLLLWSARWFILTFLGLRYFKKSSLWYFISYIPCLIFFFIIFLLHIFTPYQIIIPLKIFIGVSILLVGIVQVPVVLIFISNEIKKRIASAQPIEPSIIYSPLVNFIRWLKIHDFGFRFALLFIALLIVSTLLLIFRLKFLSEQVAKAAYFALVVGVTGRLIGMMQQNKER
jgi:hypothetical protein